MPDQLRQHDLSIRVRYHETDAMGRLHHANFFVYFELGRTELLRASGASYKQVEESGLLLVVADMACKYYLPAGYDDVLTVRTTTVRAKGARIEHTYQVFRDQDLIAEGTSTIACVDRAGKVTRLPEFLRLE